MEAKKLGILSILALCSVCNSSLAAPSAPVAGWPNAVFNPQLSGDDFVLPMPCGGQMAFRRVNTIIGEANWLADQRFHMGAPDVRHNWAEDRRFGYIAGSFSEGADPRARYFYIGKYEVTRTQLAAVGAGDCGEISALAKQPDGGLPVENAGWFDAVDFSRRYSVWLRREAAGALPKEDGLPGFVRLPTDAEWEYAARGGTLLASKQVERLFPMDSGPEDYIWFEGNCNKLTQPIGQLKPNPLGLYDILGNVSEIVLDSFRPTAPGRLHGETGGFTVRGGSCLTGEADLRTANRQEEAFFDLDGERRPPMTGFRLVVASTVGINQGRIDALLRTANGGLEAATATPVVQVAAEPPEKQDAALVDRVRKLAERANQPNLMDDLNRLASDLAATHHRHAELVGSAARSAVLSGAVLMRNYRQEMDESARLSQVLERISPENKPKFLEQIDRWNNRARLSGEAYLSLLIESTDSLGQNKLKENLPQVEASLSYEGSSGIVKMARRFVDQCQIYKENPPNELNLFLKELLKPL